MSTVDVSVLVGNGFDLKAGLRTDTRSFIEYFKRRFEESVLTTPEGRLCLDIEEVGIETWCDFECQLGGYSSRLELDLIDGDLIEEYIKSKEVLDGALREYLMGQDCLVTDQFVADNAPVCLNSVANWLGALSDRDRERLLEAFPKPIEFRYRFLCFNYTSTLQKMFRFLGTAALSPEALDVPSTSHHLFSWRFVHGTLEGAPVCGVDNPDQITSSAVRSSEAVSAIVVKPQIQELLGSNDDLGAMEDLRKSELFLIFGMSLGITDRRWWEAVCKRLIANPANRVLICARGLAEKRHSPAAYMRERNRWRERLIASSGMDAEQFTDEVKSRILVIPAEDILRVPKPIGSESELPEETR